MAVAVLALVAGVTYAVGVRRLAARGRRWSPARGAAMGGAVAAAAASAALGDATFTRHMGEHLLLGMVAPFLLALAAPMTLALQTGGPATRRSLRRLLHGPVGRLAARPAVGFCLFGGGLVAVYLTPLLERSVTSAPVHLGVHAHVLASGLLFLVPIVGVDPLPRPVPYAARLLVVLLAVPFHAFLGLAILTADDPLAPAAYPSLDDQRQAASLLWAGGELLTLCAAATVFARWWGAERRAAARAVPSPPVPAMTYAEAVAAVTAPGERFELERITVNGVDVTAFRHAPPTLRAIFDTWRDRGDATFLVYEDERWGFDEVVRHVDAIGALLVERYGVAKGDRVAIGMRNYPEWVMAFAAITSIGAVAVSLNAWWTEDELDFALDDSASTVLVADVERVERTRAAAARLGLRTLGVRLGDGARRWDDVDRYEEVLPLGAALPDLGVGPDDDATILYTSGTTGRPKGAVSTHRAVLQALMAFACRTTVARLRHPDEAKVAEAQPPVFILIVPLFHVTGSVAVMLSCAAAGLKLVMMHKWDPLRALELIEREQVTNFVGVPTQSWDLLEHPRFGEFDTSSLVSVGGGGAPAPPELVKRVDASFSRARPGIGYGMTETNAYGPQNSGEDYVSHPTSTGRWVPILEIEVRDPDGKPVPAGERGEIWFKGPHLIRGYWNRPTDTAETIVDGWLRSGDIGRVDDDGFLYVEDRAKDMVLRGGENVYCAEVEAAIYEHPAVYEAAVFGVPHERLGEEVAAAVFPRAGATLTVEALQAHVAERLAPFKVPTKVVIVGEQLPRNASGKILKRELRDQVAATG